MIIKKSCLVLSIISFLIPVYAFGSVPTNGNFDKDCNHIQDAASPSVPIGGLLDKDCNFIPDVRCTCHYVCGSGDIYSVETICHQFSARPPLSHEIAMQELAPALSDEEIGFCTEPREGGLVGVVCQ